MDNNTYPGTHAMVPIGLVCTLELPNNLKNIRLPSLDVGRRLDLLSPRCCKESLTPLSWLYIS